MGDIPSKCNEISQCYITFHRNPFCYLIDVPLQDLQPVKCEPNKCLSKIHLKLFSMTPPLSALPLFSNILIRKEFLNGVENLSLSSNR